VDDYIIDTNVLLIASAHLALLVPSAQYPDLRFKDSEVPEEQMEAVFDWLVAFQKDDQRRLVLDHPFLKHGIYKEYHRKMTAQDY
jgi:hypothetical protein